MKLIIATPFYEMKAYAPYVVSLSRSIDALVRTGICYEYWDLCGDSYVDRARNTICSRFLDSDGTDLLFIDSDMEWDVMGFANILKSPFEVTGAAYPCKNNWEEYTAIPDTFEDGSPKVNIATGLIKAKRVPAGFLRLKRSCLEQYRKHYHDKYYCDNSVEPHNPDKKYTSFFECETIGHNRYGEDVLFCKRWAEMGGEIWIEPRITISHYGIKAWTGNYHNYLHSLAGKPNPFNLEKQLLTLEIDRISTSLRNNLKEMEIAK